MNRSETSTMRPVQPLQVRFVGMPHSPALEAIVRRRADWLKRFYPGLTAWSVTVEALGGLGQGSRRHAVRIDAVLAGHALRIDRVREDDAHVALRDAFSGMRRELQDALRRGQRNGRDTSTEGTSDVVSEDLVRRKWPSSTATASTSTPH